MQVTEAHIVRIPPTNVRVPRAEFAAVWAAVEREVSRDWYALGVAMTCRWLASTAVQAYDGRWYQAYAPVTKRSARAYEELIEAEYLAAEEHVFGLRFRLTRSDVAHVGHIGLHDGVGHVTVVPGELGGLLADLVCGLLLAGGGLVGGALVLGVGEFGFVGD